MSVSTTSRSEFMCDECYIAGAVLAENILFKPVICAIVDTICPRYDIDGIFMISASDIYKPLHIKNSKILKNEERYSSILSVLLYLL